MNLPQKRAPETKEAGVSAFPSLETLGAAGKEVNPGDKLRKHTTRRTLSPQKLEAQKVSAMWSLGKANSDPNICSAWDARAEARSQVQTFPGGQNQERQRAKRKSCGGAED